MVNAQKYSEQFFSYQARILPFIEQDNLARLIDYREWAWFQGPLGDQINGRPVRLYQCPADPHVQQIWRDGLDSAALTSYMGVNGTDQLAYDGLFHVNGRIKLTDVTDGTSNTVAVGERPPTADLYWGWWMAGCGDWPYFSAADTLLGVSERDPNNQPEYVPEFYRPGDLNDPNQRHRWHFWSLHTGGSNWLLADGSVRFLAYSAGQRVLPQMATYRGGEVVADY
jgi:prepilin-type processing-associated H-X9-DG protein